MLADRIELIKALSISKMCLATHALIPVLSHFCFDGEYIYTYNGTQGLRVKFKTDLNCAVPGDLLFKLLDSMTGDKVEIIQKEKEIRIGMGKHKSKVSILPSTDFIFSPPSVEELFNFPVNGTFLKGMMRTGMSVNDNPMIRNQSGITFLNLDSPRFYSTDGIRLSRYIMESEVTKKDFGTMFPRVFCAVLVTIGELFKEGKLYFGKDFILADYKDVQLYTMTIPDLEFLDFEEVIERCWPKDTVQPVEEIPFELFTALNRCLLFLSIQLDQYVDLTFEGNLLKIDVVSDLGEIHEEVELKNEYGDMTFSLDAKMLEQACLATKQCSFKKIDDTGIFFGLEDTFLHILRSPNI